MARSAPAFSSFTAGEVSPRMEGRITLDTYREGLAEMTNLLVLPQGGVTRRPGTEYLGEIKNSAQAARLIPFQFKTTDTYILEFGDQTMRVFRSGLQVIDATDKSITAITQASPGVITSNSHGFSNGDEIYIDDVGGMIELNGRNYRVAGATTNTFTLTNLFGDAIDTTGFTAYTSGGTATEIYNIATPYAVADLPGLRFVQSADTMFIVHPSYAIRTLTRSADNNWTFATPTITGSPSPALNSGADDYPSVVTFFEQRLVYGGTNNNPQTLWFSKNGDYNNFTAGTGADDALIYTIASNQVNAIRYLSATRVLTIGTSGGEYVLTATSDGPITPTTTLIRKYSNYGSAAIEPVQVADLTLFVQRGGRKVREFRYVGDINVSAYQAPDITIVAEHITAGGLTAFAYQQEPDGVIWAVRADGTLIGVTYRREEEVVAWHKHVIGGEFDGGQAIVESIAALPSDTGEDELYMIVKRTINGATKRYVELMAPFNFGGVTTGAFFVDGGLRYSGTAVGSLKGLYHLEGETVTILANGATHPDRDVADGGVALAFSSTTAAIGYNYTSSMQTMRIESGSADGTSQGKPKRIHAVTLRLLETVGIEVGNSSSENDRVFFRDSSMAMDQAVPLFTGDKDIEFPGGYDEDDRLFIRQTQPLPMSVLALFPRMNTFDK
jgi:hypothetical protein